jgi:hypothetical protein
MRIGRRGHEARQLATADQSCSEDGENSIVNCSNTAVKYVAELAHVREVSLLGTADLAFWKGRLLKEDLVPAEDEGKAQLLIVAADSKFMGVRFREVSFSVLVSRHDEGTRRDAAFLVHAFNSCWSFAFCERVFFSTPYQYGDVRVAASLPPSIQLIKGSEVVFLAKMQADAPAPRREPSRSGEDGWEGPVFLPGDQRRKVYQGNFFFAKIRGHTRTYPFLHPEDSITARPSRDSQILQALIDSHFAGTAWAIREDATHAKSRTYKRSHRCAPELAAPSGACVAPKLLDQRSQ